MSSINERLFGAPIPEKVKKKLEDRQRVAGEVAAGESIEAVFPNKDGDNQADLSSRTPFVRMWTSVKLISPADVIEHLDEIPKEEYEDAKNNGNYAPITKRNKAVQKANKKITNIEDLGIKIILDDNNTKRYFIVNKNEDNPIARDQVDYTEKTYIVGDYNYQKSYGEVSNGNPLPNLNIPDVQVPYINNFSPINPNISDDSSLQDLFPHQLKTNPLMKPQTGITAVTSETEGALGLIKKTTISFVVHNFYDYDRIFNQYFLKPGATIFVDFGWSSIKSLYNPDDLINDKQGIRHFLYGKSDEYDDNNGEITKNQGDLEVLQGIVTDYNSKITQNGSVECEVTLTSSNSSLLSFETDSDVGMRIKSILERGILYLGIQEIINDTDIGNDVKQLMNTPDHESDASDIEAYNKNLKLLARNLLSSKSGKPDGNSVRTGVFIENFNLDNTYISFGLFEDLIINSQFGFGKSENDINQGLNSQVRMDSSNAYTIWNKKFSDAQKIIFSVPEESPTFLYPEWWGNVSTPKSYTFQQGKIPYDVFKNKHEEANKDLVTYDKELGRIPLREIFINTDVIINAFQQNDNVKKVIKQILNDINKSSSNIMNLELTKGNLESEIKIVDKNFTELDIEPDNNNRDIFRFNIRSPNSIVKDYNLEFKLPSGNIGSMYAIQGMSHGDNIFTIKKDVVDSLNLNKVDKKSLSIIYNPDLGTHRLDQLLDTQNESEVFNVYNQVNKLISSDIYNVNVEPLNTNVIRGNKNMFSSDDVVTRDSNGAEIKAPKVEKKLTAKQLIKINDENLQAVGIKVAQSFTDYFGYQISDNITRNVSSLLPYTLSLTTYGISSIQPGDTFKVDYLPKMYLDSTYLQVIKVSHNIGSDGWYTSLDTQFRLNSSESSNHQRPTDVRLSANAILNLGLEDNLSSDAYSLQTLMGYCTNFIVIPTTTLTDFDMIVEFKTTSDLLKEASSENTLINNGWGFRAKLLESEFTFSLDSGLTKSDFEVNSVYNNEENRYIENIKFPNVNLSANSTYQFWIKGNNLIIFDPSTMSGSKLVAYKNWWNEFLGAQPGAGGGPQGVDANKITEEEFAKIQATESEAVVQSQIVITDSGDEELGTNVYNTYDYQQVIKENYGKGKRTYGK